MEDPMDQPRLNLLSVVLDRLHQQGKDVIVSRMMYFTSLKHNVNSKEELKAYHETLLRRVKGDAEVTGLLLVFPNCVLHMIEAPTKVLMVLLRILHEAAPADSLMDHVTVRACILSHSTLLMRHPKVASFTEDIPTRAFPQWWSYYVNVPVLEGYDGAEPDTIIGLISDANILMLKLGRHISSYSREELAFGIEAVRSNLPDMPTVDAVLGVVLSGVAPSLPEFLEIYDSPVDIDLESDNVWPMPAPLVF